jgi:hypothetical protein
MMLPLFYPLLLSVDLLHYHHTSLRHAISRHTIIQSFALSQNILRRRYLTLAMVSHTLVIIVRHIFVTACEAHESGTQPLCFQCALEACAPEVAFARTVQKVDNPPVELPADVWALGTAVCISHFLFSLLIVLFELRSTK